MTRLDIFGGINVGAMRECEVKRREIFQQTEGLYIRHRTVPSCWVNNKARFDGYSNLYLMLTSKERDYDVVVMTKRRLEPKGTGY